MSNRRNDLPWRVVTCRKCGGSGGTLRKIDKNVYEHTSCTSRGIYHPPPPEVKAVPVTGLTPVVEKIPEAPPLTEGDLKEAEHE